MKKNGGASGRTCHVSRSVYPTRLYSRRLPSELDCMDRCTPSMPASNKLSGMSPLSLNVSACAAASVGRGAVVWYLQVAVHASLVGIAVDVLQQCRAHPLVPVGHARPDQEDVDEAAMLLRHWPEGLHAVCGNHGKTYTWLR